MAVVLGARHSRLVVEGEPGVEVHLVLDRTGLREGGRTEGSRRVGRDAAVRSDQSIASHGEP